MHWKRATPSASIFPREELIAALAYLVLGCLWIVESDQILNRLVGNSADSLLLQTEKGLNFIVTTALVFYLILRRIHTRRRRAEAASREATERFELVARAASDAIFDWNLSTDAVWWSEGMKNLFGYPQDLTRTRMEMWSDCVHPEDRTRIAASLDRILQSNATFAAEEFRFQRKDGTFAHVILHGQVLRQGDGLAVRIVGGMSDVTARKQAELKLEQSHRQLRALSARLESLREAERTRIAREIHDELGQLLTGLKMDLSWIEKRLSRTDVPTALNPVLDKVIETVELADATIASVQKIAADLRPNTLDTLGLASAIKLEVARFQERTGIRCQVQVPETILALPGPVVIGIFRILQEALTNVARHAAATEVTVELHEHDEGLALHVRDNGRGLRAAEREGPRALGLLGMRERAELLGGEIDFTAGPGGGTCVSVRVPQGLETQVL